MTEDRLLIEELAAKGGQPDFLRTIAENVLQLIMEADVDGLIGAGRHERSSERATWRNGYRDRSLDTRVGTLNLKIPKLRAGSTNGKTKRQGWGRYTERTQIYAKVLPCLRRRASGEAV